jgi:hypothetical protein
MDLVRIDVGPAGRRTAAEPRMRWRQIAVRGTGWRTRREDRRRQPAGGTSDSVRDSEQSRRQLLVLDLVTTESIGRAAWTGFSGRQPRACKRLGLLTPAGLES